MPALRIRRSSAEGCIFTISCWMYITVSLSNIIFNGIYPVKTFRLASTHWNLNYLGMHLHRKKEARADPIPPLLLPLLSWTPPDSISKRFYVRDGTNTSVITPTTTTTSIISHSADFSIWVLLPGSKMLRDERVDVECWFTWYVESRLLWHPELCDFFCRRCSYNWRNEVKCMWELRVFFYRRLEWRPWTEQW